MVIRLSPQKAAFNQVVKEGQTGSSSQTNLKYISSDLGVQLQVTLLDGALIDGNYTTDVNIYLNGTDTIILDFPTWQSSFIYDPGMNPLPLPLSLSFRFSRS